jgi:hypothetical protein
MNDALSTTNSASGRDYSTSADAIYYFLKIPFGTQESQVQILSPRPLKPKFEPENGLKTVIGVNSVARCARLKTFKSQPYT